MCPAHATPCRGFAYRRSGAFQAFLTVLRWTLCLPASARTDTRSALLLPTSAYGPLPAVTAGWRKGHKCLSTALKCAPGLRSCDWFSRPLNGCTKNRKHPSIRAFGAPTLEIQLLTPERGTHM